MEKQLFKYLFKKQNHAYVLVWAFILANRDEGTFTFPSLFLMSKFGVKRTSLRRIINHGIEFWTQSGRKLDARWTNNTLIIMGLDGVSGRKLDKVGLKVDKINPLKEPKKPKVQHKITQSEIIGYLNTISGKSYTTRSKTNMEHINARLREGFSTDDFKVVIEKKCKEWGGTTMDKFIRPQTLFGNKFEAYLNEKSHVKTSSESKYHNALGRAEKRDYSNLVQNKAEDSRSDK